MQGKFEAVQKQENKTENKTGLPDNLKSGIENLSGVDISDVKGLADRLGCKGRPINYIYK